MENVVYALSDSLIRKIFVRWYKNLPNVERSDGDEIRAAEYFMYLADEVAAEEEGKHARSTR